MRVAVFTGNQPRHLALLESLAGIADSVFAVQECTTVFPGQVEDFFRKSDVMQRYFAQVTKAENDVFGGPRFLPAHVRQLAVKMGDASALEASALEEALDADHIIVFGASYLRGQLCDELVERRTVNIHMGISPYYRGSSCNFWAVRDGRSDLVGATVHLLTAGLDSGPVLFHAFPGGGPADPFVLGMRAVAAAHQALVDHISTRALATLEPVVLDRSLELRYTRNRDFTDEVASAYLGELPSPDEVGRLTAARDVSALQLVRPWFGG